MSGPVPLPQEFSIHPSLPNYLWLEAGTNFGILSDGPSVAADTQTTTQHLSASTKIPMQHNRVLQ
jgi:hypothetical protein